MIWNIEGIFQLITQVVLAAVATVSFSILFNVPKKELPFCGLSAAGGWFFYRLVTLYYPAGVVGASFAGTVALTAISRILCYLRKTPVTVFIIAGILPLVPGAGVYYSMYELIISGENAASIAKGVETLKIAGVIAIGIISVLSLPRGLFDLTKKKTS